MRTLQEQYFDCCDRLFLNNLSQSKMNSRILKEQIENDIKLKEDLEHKLGL